MVYFLNKLTGEIIKVDKVSIDRFLADNDYVRCTLNGVPLPKPESGDMRIFDAWVACPYDVLVEIVMREIGVYVRTKETQ